MSSTETVARQTCPTCGQNVGKRRIFFDRTMFSAMLKMFRKALVTGCQTVRIKDLNLTVSEYCNMNKLVRFGMAYKNETMRLGEYGVPRLRIAQFLQGTWKVARSIDRDCTTDTQEMDVERIHPWEVPRVNDLLLEYGPSISEYLRNENFENASAVE